MTRPNISELRRVLKEGDWQWFPHFRITPRGVADIKRVISVFYSAGDKWVDKYEHPSEDDKDKEQPLSQTKRDYEEDRQKCRDVLMTYTHAGMRKPLAVRHRRLLENLGIFGFWRSHTNLWYFAIAWQFIEWYNHVLEVYKDNKDDQLEDLTREAEQFEGGLGESLTFHFLGKQIDLLEDRLDTLLDEEEQEWYHKNLFLDVWLHLRGIGLSDSEKDDVLGWTFNRFGNDS